MCNPHHIRNFDSETVDQDNFFTIDYSKTVSLSKFLDMMSLDELVFLVFCSKNSSNDVISGK